MASIRKFSARLRGNDSGDDAGVERLDRRNGKRQRQAAHEEAADGHRPARPLLPRGGLVGLRDHDGRRPGPAGPREPRPVRRRPELCRPRPQRGEAGDPHQQRGAHHRRVRPDRADDEGGGRRDRGRAFLRAPGRRLPGDRPSALPGRPLGLGPAGWFDDHPAVREERARRPGQPDHPPEAPRGGARLPARAQLEQGQDPYRVPQLDLLRRGRLRDRGCGQDLLRQRAPQLRREPRRGRGGCRRVLRIATSALGGRDAGGDHLLSQRLLAAGEPRVRARAAQPGPGEDGRAGVHREREPAPVRAGADPSSVRGRTSRRGLEPPRTSRPGCASSWSTSTGPARRSPAGSR